MNILNPLNSWAADNLPEGLSLHNGVISGIPTVKGNSRVQVTVSNPLGSDTKNISIISKFRPGSEKFSILQDGVEVDKLTISELQAMVQDGSAQQRFNCTNTQILLSVIRPQIKYAYKTEVLWYRPTEIAIFPEDNKHFLPSVVQYVPVNFCSFRNVTLQDGSTRPGLILQFDQSLWAGYAPFDTGDQLSYISSQFEIVYYNIFNRWRYSNLRQWLNASGKNWFSPAYDGDALITFQQYADAYIESEYPNGVWRSDRNVRFSDDVIAGDRHQKLWLSNYTDDDACGFLDLLPDDLHSILQPIKIITQAFSDTENLNSSIDDPEDIDGVDADITYDKVFLPSIDEMYLNHVFSFPYLKDQALFPESETFLEGSAWEYYVHKFGTDQPFTPFLSKRNEDYEYSDFPSDWAKAGERSKINSWAKNLLDDFPVKNTNYYPNYHPTLGYYSRSADISCNNLVWTVANSSYYEPEEGLIEYRDIALTSRVGGGSDLIGMRVNPAPAFAIC